MAGGRAFSIGPPPSELRALVTASAWIFSSSDKGTSNQIAQIEAKFDLFNFFNADFRF
jgi:hypothetical protein